MRKSNVIARSVVLFQEVNPGKDLDGQVIVGNMSHWEAKQYVESQPEGLTFFTLGKKEWAEYKKELISKKPRRHRRTKAEMALARARG